MMRGFGNPMATPNPKNGILELPYIAVMTATGSLLGWLWVAGVTKA